MLTTLLRPMAGTISVLGVDAAERPIRVRRMIGYVPQLLSADATLTGRENVQLFARLFDVPRSATVAGVAASAALLPRLAR
jgi:ABC-2 type transport system ATP-binding protein